MSQRQRKVEEMERKMGSSGGSKDNNTMTFYDRNFITVMRAMQVRNINHVKMWYTFPQFSGENKILNFISRISFFQAKT